MASNRRLAAIMFTDVVGFTASADANEHVALAGLREQEAIVRPVLTPYGGREVKSTGDGFLVEFASALKAIDCAIEIQRRMQERNSHSTRRPIELRIGIHVGDVEEYRGDIFGDAVNVASRVVPLAEPGGVCLSESAFSHVRNKLSYPLEKVAAQHLKGLHAPMDLYRVLLPWKAAPTGPPPAGPVRLAVLPFTNISPDPKDEYFADGLTEELITVLSQLHELRVIARTSVAGYKTQPKPVAQIAAELGASALLEGSVRKVGDQLRITVQLVDARSQEHAWAQSYDRTLDDVFAIQAEIARSVADTLKIQLAAADEQRLTGRPPVRSESYLAYLKGRTLLNDHTETSLRAAKTTFEFAIQLDPRNAAAYSGLSDVTRVLGTNYREQPMDEWDEASRALAARAVELDPHLAEAHTSLGYSLWSDYQYGPAEQEFRAAIELNPSYPAARNWYAYLLADQVRIDEAEHQLILAEEADPRSHSVLFHEAYLLIWRGRFAEASAKIERLGEIQRSGPLYPQLRSDYFSAQHDFERALIEADRMAELDPHSADAGFRRAAILASRGDVENARVILAGLEAMPEQRRFDAGIAEIYAYLNDADSCFRWLERAAFERYDLDVAHWRLTPSLENIRRDPRFHELLRRMNLS